MNINFQQNADGSVTVKIEEQFVPEFIELVRRGSNTWERRSPDMRKFTDTVAASSYKIKLK